MPIVNPVMDMNATNNFYAHRMMIIGTNDHSLEVGWYEATWSNGTQVIYYQDSHSCNSQGCEWMGRNTPCNRSRGVAETRIISYGSTNKWTIWCYTGSVWRTMINNVNLGNLNAWEIEAAGEVYITNQAFNTILPGDGAKFEDLRLQNDNTLWYPWDTFISTSHFNDGGPYETDFVHNYYEFYVDETP